MTEHRPSPVESTISLGALPIGYLARVVDPAGYDKHLEKGDLVIYTGVKNLFFNLSKSEAMRLLPNPTKVKVLLHGESVTLYQDKKV